MKLKFALLLFLSLSISSVFAIDNTYGDISYEKAVNLSGKQRMLSQRIAKLKVLSKFGPLTDDLQAEYTSSISIFQRNFQILENNSTDQSAKVKAMVRQEKNAWNRFIESINKKNTTVSEIVDNSQELLSNCHELVLAIQEESKFTKQNSSASRIEQLRVKTINTAGKQRMLSQKLCLYYAACRHFYRTSKKDADIACNQYRNIYTTMDSVVNDLMVNELNNSEIDLLLGKILNIMETELNENRKDFMNNKISLKKVIDLSDRLLTLFNKLTTQYSLVN